MTTAAQAERHLSHVIARPAAQADLDAQFVHFLENDRDARFANRVEKLHQPTIGHVIQAHRVQIRLTDRGFDHLIVKLHRRQAVLPQIQHPVGHAAQRPLR